MYFFKALLQGTISPVTACKGMQGADALSCRPPHVRQERRFERATSPEQGGELVRVGKLDPVGLWGLRVTASLRGQRRWR